MARFSIISKDGNKIRYEGKPRYIGTYLKPSYLEFSEIASPTPIDWQVGDYIDYPRTGMRYRLYSIPQASKNARKGSHGRAFTYSNVQLHAATKELEIALFKDLVSADNDIHFSTSPDIATFEDVYGIARRIQACMDDLYPNRWIIEVADFNAVEDAEMLENITTAKDFALSGGTCLDALTKIYELWQEVGWIHTYDSASGKDVITIGYANKRIGANTTEAYIYGKGNGLTAIKKTQANKDEFATRLYVYGSDRNLPSRYYNGKYILNADSVDIRNLMIPIGQWKTTGGVPDARKAYIENAEAVAKYGIIPKTHYFDSDDAGADIYPTIEGITIGQVRRLQADYKPSTSIYPNDGERIDEVKSAVNPNDDGVIRPLGKAYKYYKIENVEAQKSEITLTDSTVVKVNKILLLTDLEGEGKVDMTVIPNIGFALDDAGFTEVNVTFELTDSPTKMKTVSKLSSVVAKKNEVTGEWEFKAPRMSVDYDFASNGSIPVCYVMTIDATLEKAKKGEIITLSISEGEIEIGANALLDKEFTITLKQIGFNIEERASIGSGKTISMKSGDNEGRNFIIKECRYNASSDSWVLTCKRQQDNNLGMLFPNKDYQIRENDRFVLLDIAMPELYLSAAMERLFVEGQKLLSKVSRIQNNYEPSIDAVVMAESGRTIREGMFMQIADEDIMDGTTEYILIDTINIYEDEAAIPTYKVTLKEKKKVSYKGTPSATTTSNTNPVEEKTDVDLSGYVTKEQFAAVEMLKDLFYKHDNETYGTKYNLFSEKEISANGLNLGRGTSGGGGLIQNVLGKSSFGTVASEDNATTFNAFAIDSLYKRIVELEGKDVEVDLSDYYTKQQTQNAITSALSPYIKATDADGKYAALASFNALQSSFDRLYSALNDDTSGVINTWNEVVDFVNEYSGSEDLSTILGKMNTDINARVKVSDFDTWKTDVFNPLSVTVTNLGKKVDTNTANINKLLGWFNVDADGNLFTTLNFYSTKEISANGISQGTGGGGSGLISSVLSASSLGATLTNDNSVVFNAYATNEIYKTTQGHASRIGVLESQVGQLTTQDTKVSVSDLLTTGTKIATITVDGVAHEVKGDFLPTSGGTISGTTSLPLTIAGNSTSYVGLGFKKGSNADAYIVHYGGRNWAVTSEGWAEGWAMLHSGNYSNYALPLSGGTMTGDIILKTGVAIRDTSSFRSFLICDKGEVVRVGVAGNPGAKTLISGGNNDPKYRKYLGNTNYNEYTLIHSGNYSQYAAHSLQGLFKSSFNANDCHNDSNLLKFHSGFSPASENIPTPKDWSNGLLELGLNANGAVAQFFFADGKPLYYRAAKSAAWKTIAFTDSTVEAAKKLVTDNGGGLVHFASNTLFVGDTIYPNYQTHILGYDVVLRSGASATHGLILNSSGNVTIGGNDYASMVAKLFVQGKLASHSVRTEEMRLGQSIEGSYPYLYNWYYASIGYEYEDKAPSTLKPAIVFKTMYNTNEEGSGVERMRISANGNVGIGTTTPAYKLDVNGSFNATSGYINGNTLIHSGNVGDYAFVPRAAVTDNTDANTLLTNGVYINATGNGIGNVNFPHGYGMFMSFATNDDYIAQIALGVRSMSARTKFGTSGWTDWKTLAFTDSNVASATKLQAARTIWGQSFDGTADVNGNLFLNNQSAIQSYTTSGTQLELFNISSNNNLSIGYSMAGVGGSYIYGNAIYLRYGSSRTTGLILNSSGNVTIGNSDLAKTNAKLYVDGTIYTTNNINLYGGYLSLRPASNVYGDIKMTSSCMIFQALHDGVAYLPISLNPNGSNILIGTTTDYGQKLQVNGNSRFYDNVIIGTSNSEDGRLRVVGKTGDANVFVVANDSGLSKFIVQNNGNVGIGTSNPNNFLTIQGAANRDTYLSISGSQYTLLFGVGSGNVNRGIYDATNNAWWIYRGSGTDTTINGGVSVGSTLTIAGATTHNGIAYFGGTTYYINTSGNANFNAISGRSLQVDSAAFNGTIHSNEYSGSVAKWSITADGAASFASLSNGGLLETSTLRVSSTSTFTGKTNHNGGIGATSLNVSGTSTLSGHVGIGISPHSTYALYVDGSLRCGPIDGGTASFGALYSDTHVPNLSETYDLGSDYYRWASIYGVGADFSGNVTVNGTLYASGTLYTNDIDGSDIYITASGDLYLHTLTGYVGADNGRWAIDGYGNYKGQSLYINPRDNDNEIITDNNKKKTHGFPREGVAVFVNGDIAATGEISANALNQGSDIRFKHQLGDITLDLDTIANAPMFRFTWTNKENSRVQIGTSAQYWKDSARELVSVDKDNFHRLDYATLGVLIGVTLGKTVKNHEDRIKELETKVESLEAENRRLRYGN